MDLNARSDLFMVNLPKIFFPEEMTKKFKGYLERLPRTHETVQSIINDSIQSITIPAINYDPAVQARTGFEQRKRGRDVYFRDAIDKSQLHDNSFTITFSAKNGFINYWMLLDLYLYHYSFPNKNMYVFDLPISILDSNGNIVFVVKMTDCLFTGISEYELNFSSNTNSFKTFDGNFVFNDLEFQFLNT